jgi:hypothetical protein
MLFWQTQWPSGLRHELFSPAQTLGSWVGISLEEWMSMCVYFVFVFRSVDLESLRHADPLSKESCRLSLVSRNWKSGQSPTRGSRTLIIIIMIIIIIIIIISVFRLISIWVSELSWNIDVLIKIWDGNSFLYLASTSLGLLNLCWVRIV